MYAFDIGLLGNITEQTFTGVGVSGIFNYTKGDTTAVGLQLAGITNVNTGKTTVYGLRTGPLSCSYVIEVLSYKKVSRRRKDSSIIADDYPNLVSNLI